jgi:hypothetical protein
MISNDIPLLMNVVKTIWCKEDELKGLKTELNNLNYRLNSRCSLWKKWKDIPTEVAADNLRSTEATKFIHSSLKVN